MLRTTLLLGLLFSGFAAPISAAPPNMVFILADDFGYGDAQALNPESMIATPHLNKLAAEGLTFTNAHTPSAVCTPTRYGVLTGRYCWRSRLKRGVLFGYSERLIEQDRPTVASLLAKANYTSAVVGKWHLGLDWAKDEKDKVDFSKPVANNPTELGFDMSYLVPASLDMAPYVYVHNERVTNLNITNGPGKPFPAFIRSGPRAEDFVMEDVLDHLTEQSVKFIREQAKTDDPFFLYFPLTAPHKPVLPHARFRDSTEYGDYGDFITQVDWVVGQIDKALAESGVADNTVLIFTSDNGSFMFRRDDQDAIDHVDDSSIQAFRADRHRANGPWRGTKADIWEAGHRVPLIVRWPDEIDPNTKCDSTVCLTDFMATAAELAGVDVPEGAGEDSYSLVPLVDGDQEWNRPPVIHHSASGMFAIRDGKWKLIAGNGSGGRAKPRGKPFEGPYMLFDLEADLAEENNVASSKPKVVKRLTDKLEEIRSSGRSVVR